MKKIVTHYNSAAESFVPLKFFIKFLEIIYKISEIFKSSKFRSVECIEWPEILF